MIKLVKEDMMGGVGAPITTLNNTPGMGNAVPPSSGGRGSGDSWGNSINKKPYTQANKPNLKVTKKKKVVRKKKKLEEENINPYDKLGIGMAKKMNIKLPFKKKKTKGNQNSMVQQKFEHQIITLEDFMNEDKFERGQEPKDAMKIGLLSKLKEFKDYFRVRYGHISYEPTDKELIDFLSQQWVANRNIAQQADLWSDYILSQGLGDVQP